MIRVGKNAPSSQDFLTYDQHDGQLIEDWLYAEDRWEVPDSTRWGEYRYAHENPGAWDYVKPPLGISKAGALQIMQAAATTVRTSPPVRVVKAPRTREEASAVGRVRTLERRFVESQVELRAKGNKRFIEGYAAVFDVWSQDLGGFTERLRPKAANKTVQEADIRALFNHDPNMVLGRNTAGTLEVAPDSHGVHYRIDPPVGTSYWTNLEISMERRDINQSSFAFYAVHDNWWSEGEQIHRDLDEISMVDVSVVTYPAYLQATSTLTRGALESLSLRTSIPIVDLSDLDAVRRALAEENDDADGRAEPLPQEHSEPTAAEIARRELENKDLDPLAFEGLFNRK